MAFSESVKLSVKRKANFTCCWCLNRQHKVEIHHIIPQAIGGSDDEENAAPLCGSCHTSHGGNPDSRKEIRLRRDHLYETSYLNNRQPIDSDIPDSNLHKLKNEEPLSIKVISSHAGPGAWNQGDPLSPFQFIIKLDLVNQSPKPIILKNFEISAFEAPHERLNQNMPLGALFFIENNNKSPINIYPHQIPSEHFGLIEYQIKIQFDDRKRLKFVPDSDAFQNYTIKLSYEYYDVTRVTHVASILVQGTFQEFKNDWLEMWNTHQRNRLHRGIMDTIVGVNLESFEQPIILDSNDKWVSIKVVNNENDHITNCYGILEVDGMPLQLGWSGGSSGFKDILRGSSALLDIARTVKEKDVFSFTTQDRGDWPEKKSGKYSVQIKVGGDFKGQSFVPILFEGYIEYKGGTELFMGGGSNLFSAGKKKLAFPDPDILK